MPKHCRKKKLNVPATIIRLDSAKFEDEPDMSHVIVGLFRIPVTYELQLGNTVSYLMKRISLPILFFLSFLG